MPMVGIFPLVEIPTGNSDKGLGNGHTQVFIPLWLQKHWGDFQTYGGGGYWMNNGPRQPQLLVLRLAGPVPILGARDGGCGNLPYDRASRRSRRQHRLQWRGYYNFDEHNHLLF